MFKLRNMLLNIQF